MKNTFILRIYHSNPKYISGDIKIIIIKIITVSYSSLLKIFSSQVYNTFRETLLRKITVEYS